MRPLQELPNHGIAFGIEKDLRNADLFQNCIDFREFHLASILSKDGQS